MRRTTARSKGMVLWVSLAIAASLSSIAHAGSGTWTSGGPDGAIVRVVAIKPDARATIFAGTSENGIFRSTNSGRTWAAANTGMGTLPIVCLAIHPTTTATLYAGTSESNGYSGGIFRSIDSGDNWVRTSLSENVIALVLDPSTPSTIYAASSPGGFPNGGPVGFGVRKSTDSGTTWTVANTGLTNLFVSALAIDPTRPATLYAGTQYGGIFRSSDAGGSWTVDRTGVTKFIHTLAVNPTTPAILYAGWLGASPSEGGVLKSTDSGGTWTPSNMGLQSQYVSSLTIDPKDSRILYAAAGGLFKSTDAGGSWASTGLADFSLALAIDPTDSATLYSGGGDISRSTDSGGSWALSSRGLTTLTVSSIAVNPLTPTDVYAGLRNLGGFRSTDSGASWATTGLSDPNVRVLAIDPASSTTLYAGSSVAGVLRSTDSAMTWAPANTGLTNLNIAAFAIDGSSPATLYAATDDRVFKSTDAGGTWAAARTGITSPFVLSIAIDPGTSSTLYVGTADGVFKSANFGKTWVSTGLSGQTIFVLATNQTSTAVLYAAGSGFFSSTDSGSSWTAGAGLERKMVNAFAVHPTNPALLYAGTEGNGVFRSTDAGGTWASANTGLPILGPAPFPSLTIHALAFDRTGATLFAGLDEGSVWQLTAGGPLQFYTLTPCRLIDTRHVDGPTGGPALAAGLPRIFTAANHCGVPATARAVSLNATAGGSSSAGDLRLFAGDTQPPPTTTLRFASGQNRANNLILELDVSGAGTFAVQPDVISGSVDLIVDVNGFYQ